MITNNRQAFIHFADLLKLKGYRIIKGVMENHERDLFLVAAKNGTIHKFYLKFRKNVAFENGEPSKGFFLSFYRQFPSFFSANKELGAFGESMNPEVLERAIYLGTEELVFCYADSVCYSIDPRVFKNFAEEHALVRPQEKENYYNAMDYSGNRRAVNELCYSIPIKLLRRFC
jgi:hypothetical protein